MASPEREAAQAEAEARLDELLRELGPVLKATLRRICPRGLGIQTDEVEQEVRVRLWQSLRAERILTSPASYLKRVAVTAVIDAVRRTKARREEPLPPGEAGFERLRSVAPPPASPLALVEARETMGLVEGALQRLQAARGRAVRLHLQGFGSQEIAELLGWTEPKARNLVYRGLADLRRELRRSGLDVEDR